ncbi:MAG: Transcriptional regulator containing domain, AraC family [Paenibacillus sp.]|jgi:AraC-like DNA-binding protein|nr:Transcriptional regulator containing domain, AraC family [Paenibacillus sp.]
MIFQTELIHCWYRNNPAHFAHTQSTRPHWYILAAGTNQFWYKIGETEGYAKVGDVIVCPPDWTLFRHSPDPLEFLSISFDWHFEREPFSSNEQAHPIVGPIAIQDRPRYLSTLKKYKELSTNAAPLPAVRFYFTRLLDDLLITCLLEQQKLIRKKPDDPIMANAIRYIEENAEQQISLKQVADYAALSQAQFCRRFQAASGLSPMQYLTGIRLRKAESLLLETAFSIDQIAVECGYQNGFYFSRVFSKAHGISPSKYRDMYRI